MVAFSFFHVMKIPNLTILHIWGALIDEELSCQREAEGYTDPFAVVVMKDHNIVGHVPRKILTVCSLFLN